MTSSDYHTLCESTVLLKTLLRMVNTLLLNIKLSPQTKDGDRNGYQILPKPFEIFSGVKGVS